LMGGHVLRPWRSLLAAAVAAVLVVVATATSPTAASAAPSDGKVDGAVAAALDRVMTGKATAADVALVTGDPDLARVVPDRSKTTVVKKASPGLDALLAGQRPIGTLGVEVCGNWIEITVTVYTALGFVLFQWMHHVGFCFDPDVGVVSRWQSRFDRLVQADATIVQGALSGDWASPLPASPAQSGMQRSLQQCILTYGCWANWYPWAEAWIWGNGSWGYRGGPG
jgi:hypothetical protein